MRKHSGTLGVSPSIQIREDALQKARRDRVAVWLKENEELAIAFTPDFYMDYVRHLESLHSFGQSEADLAVLGQVSQDPLAVNDAAIAQVAEQRRETLATVRRRLRAASFQARVMSAYDRKCALCGLQMELVHASHIVPVVFADSTDRTSNGVCLCVLHHLAYDNSLITFDDTYRVLINRTEMRRLEQRGLAGGRDAFVRGLRQGILLPRSVSDRPHVDYVRRGNEVRGWGHAETETVDEAW